MITRDSAPLEWSSLMYELEDAKEHLEELISKMTSDPDFDEVEFRIRLGHIYSHLNRAWNRRDLIGEEYGEQWLQHSQFPVDLTPV